MSAPLVAPHGLTAVTVSSSTIRLTWGNPTESGLDYNYYTYIYIERSLNGTTYSTIAHVWGTDTRYSDTTCGDGTRYYYRVKGWETNADVYSPASNVANTITILPAPTNLAAVANSTSKITLTWKDNSTNEAGFEVYMKHGGGAYGLEDTKAKNAVTDATTGLEASTLYCFKVRAINAVTSSSYSNVVCVATNSNEEVPVVPSVTLLNRGHQDIDVIDAVNVTTIKAPVTTVIKTVETTEVLTNTFDVIAADGATYKIDTTHADAGYPVSSYIRTKDLDFTDQHPDIAGMMKTIRKFRLIYEDIDASTPITAYISNDGGANWSASSATVGTGDGRVKTQDFYFMNSECVTGLTFTFKLDCLSTAKAFLWLAFEIDFFVRGEHFNV